MNTLHVFLIIRNIFLKDEHSNTKMNKEHPTAVQQGATAIAEQYPRGNILNSQLKVFSVLR